MTARKSTREPPAVQALMSMPSDSSRFTPCTSLCDTMLNNVSAEVVVGFIVITELADGQIASMGSRFGTPATDAAPPDCGVMI
mmetsp:Transcript_119049/g.237387  ORF Transcript_119049/g.237387 Transcript_119049/m.237387 type:complete len:83 (-) Transcript_119049:937-1185(-)